MAEKEGGIKIMVHVLANFLPKVNPMHLLLSSCTESRNMKTSLKHLRNKHFTTSFSKNIVTMSTDKTSLIFLY